jgi:sulfur carrier protein
MREGDRVFPPAETATRTASVLVNGAPHPWRLGLTVADVIDERDIDDAAVATAVNGRFVPRPARLETPLWPDDSLVAFSAIVGG